MDKPLSLDEIEKLLGMLDEHEVVEFKLERGGERLILKRRGATPLTGHQMVPQIQQVFAQAPGGQPFSGAMMAPAPSAPASSGSSAATSAATDGTPAADVSAKPEDLAPKKNVAEISSPMVGTFYRRPAVDADPYVEVGDYVKKGDVLCIVEAMKLMNEIDSDVSGRVVDICLEDGQMVEYGEKLFRIEVG